MPTYSYRCTQCDTAFDIHQAFTDASLTECPSCQGALRKIFSAVGVTFSGSGFYRNDSRAADKASKSKSAAKSGSGSSGSSSSGAGAAGSSASGSGTGASGSGGSTSTSGGSGAAASTPASKPASTSSASS